MQQWMTAEVLSMFRFHHMRSVSSAELRQIIERSVPKLDQSKFSLLVSPLVQFATLMTSQTSSESSIKTNAPDHHIGLSPESSNASISLRQILRIIRYVARHPTKSDHPAAAQQKILSKAIKRFDSFICTIVINISPLVAYVHFVQPKSVIGTLSSN